MRGRADVFFLTWIAYASYYISRKPFSVAKATVQDQLGLTLGELGAIDTGYLAAYAAGQFASGLICDVVGARRLVGFGMLASAAVTATMGASSTMAVFAIAFALNGIFQSTGWPGTVKAMTAWCAPEERGRVMGPWSTCYQVGGLAATSLATFLLVHWGWRTAFFVPAAWTGAIGVAVLLWLRERPATAIAVEDRPKPRAWAIYLEPLVWTLGGAYFCLKLIRYTLLFWLPFFLQRELGYAAGAAGYLSLSFEVGGAIGTVAIGRFSDRWPRGRVLVGMTLLLAGALWSYGHLAALGPVANFLSMAMVGFCLFGPDALVSSVAAQDLGGVDGAGTAAGAINGVGSVGAIVQGMLTAWMAARWGWAAVFNSFIVLALVATVALLPYARKVPSRDTRPPSAQGSSR